MTKNLLILSASIFFTSVVTAQNLGNNNTAVGDQSLTSLTTGAKNVAVGNSTLRATTTGEGNIAFGIESLKKNTAGSYNTAVGGYSLLNATLADENTAIGHKSMQEVTGGENTAVGFRSLAKTTGEGNVALGFRSGESIATGSFNITIGSGTGGSSNSSYNILLGYGTGSSAIGENNIILGKKVTLPDASANKMNIGGVLYGTGFKSNTTLSSDPVGGRIGINVMNPTATLDVLGNAKISSTLSVAGDVNFSKGMSVAGNTQLSKLYVSGTSTFSGTTQVGGALHIGIAPAALGSYGQQLHFGPPETDNYDRIFIARYNVASDQSELRVNVGDDFNDKFVVGRKAWDKDDFESMFTVVTNGNVGIGKADPEHELDVAGTIRATEVKIELSSGADFVFEEDYNLMPINELQSFVTKNKHLPEIPPANDMVKEGVDMGEFQIKLLQKIEELTLYAIQQQQEIQALKDKIGRLEEK